MWTILAPILIRLLRELLEDPETKKAIRDGLILLVHHLHEHKADASTGDAADTTGNKAEPFIRPGH